MMYLYGIITTALLGLAAWIYSLLQANSDLKERALQAIINNREKEWADKIAAQNTKVSEETRDYEQAKKDFTDKFGSDDGDSGKPS